MITKYDHLKQENDNKIIHFCNPSAQRSTILIALSPKTQKIAITKIILKIKF